MIWFAYSVGGWFSKTMSYGVTDASGRVTRRDDFKAPFSSMAHDFLVTRRHALFPVLPLTGDLRRAMRGGPPFAWEPDKGSHVGVMRRDAGVKSMRWFTTEPCYVFHPMNAWEEGETIFADVMEYPVAPLFPNADGSMPDAASARLVRWTFDLVGPRTRSGASRWTTSPANSPASTSGARACPIATAGSPDDPAAGRAKDSTASPMSTTRPASARCGGSPRATCRASRCSSRARADAPEGDGWILTLVYRGAEDRSDLVVFDAGAIEAGPIGVARLPRRVPFGFHGNWRPA